MSSKNIARILASASQNDGLVTAEEMPGRDRAHRYRVKSVEIEYFSTEKDALDYARETYGLTWTPQGKETDVTE